MTKVTGVMFTPELAAANVAGRKTQTRRTTGLRYINDNPGDYDLIISGEGYKLGSDFCSEDGQSMGFIPSPCGGIGDIIWCREAFSGAFRHSDGAVGYNYKADSKGVNDAHLLPFHQHMNGAYSFPDSRRWTPAIHMPREACRWWGEITGVRVERLLDISEDDAKAEGVEIGKDMVAGQSVVKMYKDYVNEGGMCRYAKDSFFSLCQSIAKKGEPDPVKHNPWVWVYEYKPVAMPEDFLTTKK